MFRRYFPSSLSGMLCISFLSLLLNITVTAQTWTGAGDGTSTSDPANWNGPLTGGNNSQWNFNTTGAGNINVDQTVSDINRNPWKFFFNSDASYNFNQGTIFFHNQSLINLTYPYPGIIIEEDNTASHEISNNIVGPRNGPMYFWFVNIPNTDFTISGNVNFGGGANIGGLWVAGRLTLSGENWFGNDVGNNGSGGNFITTYPSEDTLRITANITDFVRGRHSNKIGNSDGITASLDLEGATTVFSDNGKALELINFSLTDGVDGSSGNVANSAFQNQATLIVSGPNTELITEGLNTCGNLGDEISIIGGRGSGIMIVDNQADVEVGTDLIIAAHHRKRNNAFDDFYPGRSGILTIDGIGTEYNVLGDILLGVDGTNTEEAEIHVDNGAILEIHGNWNCVNSIDTELGNENSLIEVDDATIQGDATIVFTTGVIRGDAGVIKNDISLGDGTFGVGDNIDEVLSLEGDLNGTGSFKIADATVLLTRDDQLSNNAIVLQSGKLNTGGFSVTSSGLTMEGDAIIDLADNPNSWRFGRYAGNGNTLSIWNWNGIETLDGGQNGGGGDDQIYLALIVAQSDLDNIEFFSDAGQTSLGTAYQLPSGEIVPGEGDPVVPVITTPTTDFCAGSTEGTDFWFGFMMHRYWNSNHYNEVTMTSKHTTTYSVYYGSDLTNPVFSGTILPNSSVSVRLDSDESEASLSEKIENKAVYIVSDSNMNVYALNYDRNSADVAVIYPTPSLGEEYYAACYTPTYDVDQSMTQDNTFLTNFQHANGTFLTADLAIGSNAPRGFNSEFLIVATEDSTFVEITPSVSTFIYKTLTGETTSVMLNKGEVYQIQSKNLIKDDEWFQTRPGQTQPPNTEQGDLTGSHIFSDKPIAVFSGNLGTTVPANSQFWDHLYEQIPPVSAWGNEYLTSPLESRTSDIYRIIAAKDSTNYTISFTGETGVLNAGEFYEFELSDASLVSSDSAIMLVQYSQSGAIDGVGDPFMIVLNPTSAFKGEVTFNAYDSDVIDNYYINVITKTSNIGNILLDGSSIVMMFEEVIGTDFSLAQVEISSGSHQLISTNFNIGFLAYQYGYGTPESYGYGIGFNLGLKLDITAFDMLVEDTLKYCAEDGVILSAIGNYDKYEWSTGDTTKVITSFDEGKVWLKADNVNCQGVDTIFIERQQSSPNLGPDIEVCAYVDQVQLILPVGFNSYEWSTGESDVNGIRVDSTGQYSVMVTGGSLNCPGYDTINVTFVEVDPASFTFESNMPLSTLLTSSQSDSINYGFQWNFGDDPEIFDTTGVVNHLYDLAGEYTVTLIVRDALGCYDTIQDVVFVLPPDLFLPNAFRPNGDIEANRIFNPIPLNTGATYAQYGIREGTYNFFVFNRWGQRIFESEDINFGWDGYLDNFNLANPGTYVFVVRYTDLQGEEVEYKGNVVLLK